jgi:methylenetetrahydrofolate reductase (NADPH)
MLQAQPAFRGFSFEFFPPKSAVGRERLGRTVGELAALRPSFVSVTFGAGGSTREGSFQTASEIVRTTGLAVTPHLSCIGSSRDQVRSQLETYRTIGVRHVVALRGDPPQGEDLSGPREFRYATDLVAFIRAFGGFRISVACYPEFHPESSSPEDDLENFTRKVEAGADEAITQYFYSNDAYFSFVEAARQRGVTIPIVPGLMPLTDFRQVERFSQFCGTEIPQWIRKRMASLEGDAAGQEALGIELAAIQADALLRGGAPGIHFYTLNRAEPTLALFERLGLAALAANVPRDEPLVAN